VDQVAAGLQDEGLPRRGQNCIWNEPLGRKPGAKKLFSGGTMVNNPDTATLLT